MLFTTNAAAFMTSLAVDVAAAKIFLSQSLYALFAIQGIFSLARNFLADKCHLPITHIPQISCKLIEVWFLVAEKLTIKVHLEHFKVTLEEEGKFANVLVIQSNDHVVTAMDKAIGIHCSYDIGNKTEEIDLNITNPGSSDKSRGKPSLPDLTLHIVDMKGEERETVSLGELLRVQVRMSDEDTYGIFVRNLVAKDGSGGNNLTLIDNTGCPVEVKMMREVRTIEPQSKSLEGYLEAFTFTGSSMLELEAEVETCLEFCKPVLCQIPTGRREDDTETVSSFGRKKRESGAAEEVLSSVTLSRSVAVQAEDFASVKSLVPENYASPVTAPSPLGKHGSLWFLLNVE
ncbi:uncharacterized protein TNCT_265771 [Trichonephila clavata]|uniref:ZP domain-containing protein n=1 Tax=Trichonephila clavata TaxID=2740835 RepID=A0A8X6GCM1_TRICU|nr:uncharacterized protein TNCT_265771 [Trichonephila clavata]